MMPATPHRQHGAHASAPVLPQARPGCRNCGASAHLSYDAFVPACYGTEGQGLAASVVSYTCKQCGSHYSQHGPEGWVPPGWQWYD